MLRINIILSVLFNSLMGFAQTETPLNLAESEVQLQRFILENLDSIRANCDYESIHFIAEYDYDINSAKNIGFYSKSDYLEDNKIEVWNPLEDYAQELFKFVPNIDPDSHQTQMQVPIILEKESLEEHIKLSEELLIEEKKFSDVILPNSLFKLKIKTLFYTRTNSATIDIRDVEIYSKLNGLNSNAIWLDDHTALVMRIITTSYTSNIEQNAEVYIYHRSKLIYNDISQIIDSKLNLKASSINESVRLYDIDLSIVFH